jgi:hypothetical protein
MTPRERQVELAKVVAGLDKAVRGREVAALLVVALRHDGQVTHGAVLTAGQFPEMLRTAGEILRRVGVEIVGEKAGSGGGDG